STASRAGSTPSCRPRTSARPTPSSPTWPTPSPTTGQAGAWRPATAAWGEPVGPGSPRPPVHGAVLCGGASRRVGGDKALIRLDGRAPAVRGARALAAAGAGLLEAVGGDVRALRAAGQAVAPDRAPGPGPL